MNYGAPGAAFTAALLTGWNVNTITRKSHPGRDPPGGLRRELTCFRLDRYDQLFSPVGNRGRPPAPRSAEAGRPTAGSHSV